MSAGGARERIDELFDRALDLPAAARADFLDTACGERTDLRAEVEELLRLADHAAPGLEPESLAQGPLWHSLATELGAPRPPPAERGRIGRWRVVEELGRGGMGTVFLVERADGQFEQRAALKVLTSWEGSEENLRRFELERQILASLAHANVARLLDGGRTADGRPYFVMEHVQGRPIDRHCDDLRLTVDQRLELVSRVGRALEHAHRNLVVHRDVKPSNVAVTAEGEVKLLDFGIAKLLVPVGGEDPGAPTRALGTVLTPEYASPEQVRGEPITTSSDVYQLGLLLFELLTGRRAQRVTSSAPAALEQAVCETLPLRPSAQVRASASAEVAAARRTTVGGLARKLSGDLDNIVLCALRKEPERRYASVGELLDDLERYRRGLPIRARRDRWGYRAGKFAGRHRAALAWAFALAVVTSWALVAWSEQRLRAARQAERAEQVEAILSDLFVQSSAGPPEPRNYVDHAVELVRGELGGEAASQSRLLAVLGETYTTLGLYEEAIDIHREALALRQLRFGEDSVEAADSLEALARSQHYRGLYPAAEDSLRRSLAIRRLRWGETAPATLRAGQQLGDLLHTQGRLTEAEAVLRATLDRLGTLGADRYDLARTHRDLANVLRDRGALAEAEHHYREAIRGLRAESPRPDAEAASAGVYYARLLILRGDLAQAETLLVDSLADLRQVYDGDHPLTGTALRNLGYLRIEQGRYEEAEALLDEAVAVLRKWLGPEHSMVARARAHQAELARRRGRPDVAIELARDTLGRFSALGFLQHPSALDACNTLASALLELGETERAAEVLRPCLGRARQQLVPGDPRLAAMRRALAGLRAPASP